MPAAPVSAPDTAETPVGFRPTELDAVREELERIPERELLPISAHPFTAALTVIGAAPKIAPSLFAQRKRRKRTAPVEGGVEGAAVPVRDDGAAPRPGMPGSSPFIDS